MYYSLNHNESTTETPDTPPTCSRMNPGTLYEILVSILMLHRFTSMGKHSYVHRNTKSCDFEKLIDTITSAISGQNIVNSHVSGQLEHMYPLILKYADTEQDREIIKALTGL